jgi:outer membrane protein TolC
MRRQHRPLRARRLAALALCWGLVLALAAPAGAQPKSRQTKATASAQDAFTIGQAVSQGLAANPSIESRQKLLEQAQLNIGTQRGAFFPTISGFYSHQNYLHHGIARTADDVTKEQASYGLRLTQPVFAGFGILNSYLRAKIQADLEKERYRQSKLDLVFNIQSEFIRLLRDKRDLVTVRGGIDRLQQQLEAAEAFYKVGMAPYVNVLQSKLELEKAQREEINIQNSAKMHQAQLASYLSIPFDKVVDYQGDLDAYPTDIPMVQADAVNMAMAGRPDVLAAKRNIEIAAKDANVTASQYFPKVNVQAEGGEVDTRYEQDRYQNGSTQYLAVTLNVTWELFNGGSTTYAYLGNKKRLEALKKEFDNTVNNAEVEIVKAYTAINDAQKLLEVCRTSIEQAKEAYAMAKKRYDTQIGTITDLTDTVFKLTKAYGDYNQALAEFHLARAKLFYNVGEERPDLR